MMGDGRCRATPSWASFRRSGRSRRATSRDSGPTRFIRRSGLRGRSGRRSVLSQGSTHVEGGGTGSKDEAPKATKKTKNPEIVFSVPSAGSVTSFSIPYPNCFADHGAPGRSANVRPALEGSSFHGPKRQPPNGPVRWPSESAEETLGARERSHFAGP